MGSGFLNHHRLRWLISVAGVMLTTAPTLAQVEPLPVEIPEENTGVGYRAARSFRLGFVGQFSTTGGDVTPRLTLSGDVRHFGPARRLVLAVYVDASQETDTGKRLKPARLPATSLPIQDVVRETSFLGGGVAARYYFGQTRSEWQPYAGGAVGLYAIQYVRLIGTVPPGAAVSDDARRLGGKLFLGLDYADLFFAELDYNYPGQREASGIGVQLGIRF